MTDVLEQEEIDALMDGISSGEVESSDGSAAPRKSSNSCDAYDFSREDHSLRKLWPAITLISERFKQQFQAAFSALIRRGAVLSEASIQSMNFEEYLNSQKDVTSINFLSVNPLNSLIIVTFDADLVYTAVDVFFGSNDIEQRTGSHAFTSAESRIMYRILEAVCPAMQSAWEAVMPMEFTLSHSETNPQFVKDFAPGDAMLVASFDVDIGKKVGSIQMVLPASSIEPIKDQLAAINGADSSIPDAGWTSEFKQGIADSPVELQVQLAEANIHLRDLLNLKEGDIIPIDLPSQVEICAGSMPMMRGSFGVSSGQKAIKITEWITPSKRDAQ